MKLYGIVGWKNAGKTGLMERLVTEFTTRGLRVSTLKHAHHAFDIDRPGKDSHRHRMAGAQEVLVASKDRWALMHELRGAAPPPLSELLARLSPVDIVLVEGWKGDPHPKIEAWRTETGQAPLAPEMPSIRAVATDAVVHVSCPVFDLNDTNAIADFILAELQL
ncbi:MAG: molybdopterin-guanine dinucleotide biosynthesis protein B [Pseudomonadota bacterium]